MEERRFSKDLFKTLFLSVFFLTAYNSFSYADECSSSFETKKALAGDSKKSFSFFKKNAPAKQIKETYKKFAHRALKNVEPDIEIGSIEFITKNGEKIYWFDHILAKISGKEVFLKQIEGKKEIAELATYLALKNAGVETLFKGVIKSSEGNLYIMQQFIGKKFVNSVFVEGFDSFVNAQHLKDQMNDLMSFFSKHGILSKETSFIASENFDIYITHPNFQFLGKPLKSSLLKDVEMEFTHILKNAERHRGVFQNINNSVEKNQDASVLPQKPVNKSEWPGIGIKEQDAWEKAFAGQKTEMELLDSGKESFDSAQAVLQNGNGKTVLESSQNGAEKTVLESSQNGAGKVDHALDHALQKIETQTSTGFLGKKRITETKKDLWPLGPGDPSAWRPQEAKEELAREELVQPKEEPIQEAREELVQPKEEPIQEAKEEPAPAAEAKEALPAKEEAAETKKEGLKPVSKQALEQMLLRNPASEAADSSPVSKQALEQMLLRVPTLEETKKEGLKPVSEKALEQMLLNRPQPKEKTSVSESDLAKILGVNQSVPADKSKSVAVFSPVAPDITEVLSAILQKDSPPAKTVKENVVYMNQTHQ